MKLVASMVVRNEKGRYLEPCIESLLDFCDEIRVIDDASDDGTYDFLESHAPKVVVHRNPDPGFYVHEGQIRNQLITWTLQADPTYILAIDADEFVGDGQRLRSLIEGRPGALGFTLQMTEVWNASSSQLEVRQDGGWKARPCPILFAPLGDRHFFIPNKALACGREPQSVRNYFARGKFIQSGISVLHFGWANKETREQRYNRYVVHDGGQYHANSHLQSIMWTDERVQLVSQLWPPGLSTQKEKILACAGG